ncbi:MAG: F0F1 ATP synthase subunit A [Patescibacteria group bacterium]|nr:F0F1 ATP synthase subunit A [Patescibacteria group bacterium]
MNGGLKISLAAERLFILWGIPVTNSLLTAWCVIVLLVIVGYFVGRNPQLIPGKVQAAFEWLFEFVLNYMEETLGSRELAVRFFPLIVTIFFFILASNLLEFLPFFGSVGLYQNGALVPLFRSSSTDLNTTLALALIAYFVIELTGVVMLGFLRYGSKFVNFKGGALGFLIGIIEFISNLARLISFSFRLFGNIFAGEVLIVVVISFLPLVLPVPLMLFETFVGLVQAAIFALLTLVFIKIAISEPHGEHEPAKAH